MAGGGESIFKKPHFKRFSAKFFSKFSKKFSKGQKGSVNLTFNAFLHRKFSSRCIMVPEGSKRGSVNLDVTCSFYENFSPFFVLW